jgi:hypothetical protein
MRINALKFQRPTHNLLALIYQRDSRNYNTESDVVISLLARYCVQALPTGTGGEVCGISPEGGPEGHCLDFITSVSSYTYQVKDIIISLMYENK